MIVVLEIRIRTNIALKREDDAKAEGMAKGTQVPQAYPIGNEWVRCFIKTPECEAMRNALLDATRGRFGREGGGDVQEG